MYHQLSIVYLLTCIYNADAFSSNVILFPRYSNNKFQIQGMFKSPILQRKGGYILIKPLEHS